VSVTEEAINRVQEHFDRVRPRPLALARRFYRVLFEAHPELRPLFPADMTALYGHLEATLSRVISNLGRVTAVDAELRDLGARHLQWGAQPHHYPAVRDALLKALEEESGGDWNDTLAHDWRLAITMVIVPMLRGAAVETATVAQTLAAEDTIEGQ
jgi:hemoglobin-like flavoprotein